MLRPFRSRRFHRAGDKAAGTLQGNAVSRPRSSSLRRVPAPFPPVPYHPFESIRTGLRQPQSPSSVQGKWHAVNRALGQLPSPVLVYALAANGSQTGEGFIQGQVQQVPAQS
ncbi:hypothetical protein IE979_02040 [Klebsiella pneumoniae]|uniref:Uncharacterized protein n=1 Tax=Klebsiella pneumoniae TaxID=573 RepID=A0A927DRA1_KLEPN|nr:hypothetical protein [Klebsiella pneumoniae]